jgi:hypothetical protein
MVGVSLNSDPCSGTRRALQPAAQTSVWEICAVILADLSLFNTFHGTKLIVAQLLKKCLVFYSIKNFIIGFTRDFDWFLSPDRQPQFILS